MFETRDRALVAMYLLTGIDQITMEADLEAESPIAERWLGEGHYEMAWTIYEDVAPLVMQVAVELAGDRDEIDFIDLLYTVCECDLAKAIVRDLPVINSALKDWVKAQMTKVLKPSDL